MGGWAEFLEFLASENIDGDKMDLGVTVLASLGGGHVDDLARAVLDHNETVLSQGRALHGESGRGAGIDGLEGVIMLLRGTESVSIFCLAQKRWIVEDSSMRPAGGGAVRGECELEIKHTWASSAILTRGSE